jgi:hypothetical protein
MPHFMSEPPSAQSMPQFASEPPAAQQQEPEPAPLPMPGFMPEPAAAEQPVDPAAGRHGGTPARSLADLGISVGESAGGRRRAPDPEPTPDADAPTPPRPMPAVTVPEPAEQPEPSQRGTVMPFSDAASQIRSGGSRRRRSRSDLGLGDLLAEALVAYQNARDSGESTGTDDEDEQTDSRWPLPRWDSRAE